MDHHQFQDAVCEVVETTMQAPADDEAVARVTAAIKALCPDAVVTEVTTDVLRIHATGIRVLEAVRPEDSGACKFLFNLGEIALPPAAAPSP